MTTDADDVRFEAVEWDGVGGGAPLFAWRTWLFLLVLGLLAACAVYETVVGLSIPLVARSPTPLDWLFVLSWAVFGFFVLVPLAERPRRTRRYWRRLRGNRLAVASLVYLVGFALVGTFGPVVLGRPETDIVYKYQPPLFFSTPQGYITLNCAGAVGGTAIDPTCTGSLRYPLGTDGYGKDMITVLVAGTRVSLQVGLITSALVVPIATAVGTTAGYVGGLVDDLLMRYVDVQQSVPAFLVYLVLLFVFGSSLFLIVVVFGLLSWGGVARLVRSEVLQRREEGYVLAAKNAGVGHLGIVRRHLLPNVSNTVLTATAQTIPFLILTEAALAYLRIGDRGRLLPSWGETVAFGLRGPPMGGTEFPALDTWWIWLFPVLLLSVTVLALSVLGDALRDVLDPRGEP